MKLGAVFSDFLSLPWEQARGYIKEELEQLRAAVQGQWAQTHGTDGLLSEESVLGAGASVPSYIANTGPKKQPKWDKVDLQNGVKNRIKYVNLPQPTNVAQSVIGNAGGIAFEEVPVSVDLIIDAGVIGLTQTGVIPGTYGTLTVDNKGRITDISGPDVATSGTQWSVLTNGDATTPELIFAGGDVIMVEY